MGRFRSLVSTAVASWALVALPALCTGGVLLHLCDCPHSEGSSHQDDEGCGHESECATDPCGTVVTRPHDDHEPALELHSVSAMSASPILFGDSRVFLPIIWSSPPRGWVKADILDALTSTILLI